MDRLLARPEHPSALFVTADRTALGVVHRLLARGVRVPGGLAVVGYDIPCAACAQVPLTTVAVAARELGELAAEIRSIGWMAGPRLMSPRRFETA